MIRRDYLVVGAGGSGVSACEGIRDFDAKGSILLVGAESALPYLRPHLLRKILGKNGPESADVPLIQPAAWFEKNRIDFRTETTVTQFNLERRVAVLSTGQAIEFRKACLAMGSRARRPPVAGMNLGNVFTLRTKRDVIALREMVELERHITVVGGGFIATEAAALLTALPKTQVTLLHRGSGLLTRLLGAEIGHWLAEYFAQKGTKLMLGETLNGFEGRTILKNVQTKSGTRFPAGLAVVALGLELNLSLVAETPLAYPHGSPVNEYLETDEKGIFAAGDIAAYPDRIFGGTRRVDQWDTVIAQGRVAGANMTGKKRIKFEHIPHGTLQLFDLKFDYIGHFGRPPTRVDLEGELGKKKFVARCYQQQALSGVVLCNETPARIAEVLAQFQSAPRPKTSTVR